jgi:hypothetical protein
MNLVWGRGRAGARRAGRVCHAALLASCRGRAVPPSCHGSAGERERHAGQVSRAVELAAALVGGPSARHVTARRCWVPALALRKAGAGKGRGSSTVEYVYHYEATKANTKPSLNARFKQSY